jgi:hypothetical protein
MLDDFNQLDGLNDNNDDLSHKDEDIYTRKKDFNNWYDVERTKNTSAIVTEYTLSNTNLEVCF